MIVLENGHIQNYSGMVVPNGSISFQLNLDASVIASPGGLIPASQIVIFQFDANGDLVQPAQIYSNAELNPQNASGLGTFYLVTIYDANGAPLNASPMYWQFIQAANSTVNISTMTAYFTGGTVIYYPAIGGVPGTDTEVIFNEAGVLAGDSDFTWNYSTKVLSISTLNLTNPLAVIYGGTGTATPALVPGANIAITGTWPNQTIAVSPTTGSGPVVLATSPVLTTPNIGTPSAGVLTHCTGLPTVSAVQYVMDGGGLTPATGSWGQIQIPYNCTITSVTLTADQSGSAVVDLLVSTYSGFPGSLASITASDKPTLSSAQQYTDSTLSGWTIALAAGDILQIYLDSVSTCTRLNLTMTLAVVQ